MFLLEHLLLETVIVPGISERPSDIHSFDTGRDL